MKSVISYEHYNLDRFNINNGRINLVLFEKITKSKIY